MLNVNQDIQDTLNELCTLCGDSIRLYALIDAAQRVAQLEILRQHFPDVSLRGLFIGTAEQSAQSAGPFLVALNPFEESHYARLSWLITAEKQAPCVVWLWSCASPDILFKHLQQQLIVGLPDGSEALLRFFDPRVMQKIMTGLFDTQQIQALMQFVEYARWYLPDFGYQDYPENTRLRQL